MNPPGLKMDHGDGAQLFDALKVMEQYAKLVSQACHQADSPMGKFLHGAPGSAEESLHWLEKLCLPCAPLSAAARDRVEHQLSMHLLLHPGLSRAAALGELFMEEPASGEGFLRACLPDECALHHLEACKLHLRLGSKAPIAPAAVPSYGLLYPLLLCAKSMPTLNDWLPVDLHHEGGQWEELLTELNTALTMEEALSCAAARFQHVDWAGDAGRKLASTLDRACVLMRVHAGRCCSLDKALKNFPVHPVSPELLWRMIVGESLLQKSLPPSCLAPAEHKRATWGFSCLTPRVQGSAIVIDGGALAWLGGAPESRRKPDKNPGDQLCNVLSRMGEVALCPTMVYAMHSPKQAKYSLSTGGTLFKPGDPVVALFKDPAYVLKKGKDLPIAPESDVFMFLSALADKMPRVKTIELKKPHGVVAWRVDPPQRAVAFTGKCFGGFSMTTFAPHMLRKSILQDEKPCAESASHISLAAEDACERHVASLLAHYASTKLCLTENTSQQTALMEGMAVFSTTEPILRTEVPLRGSASWDNDHQDSRYAETQTGANGFRYREWVAVYSDAKQILKCRLDSHTIYAPTLHTTLMPWCRLADGNTEWVSVASSAKPDVKVLYERAKHKDGDFASFVCSVKSRFLQDLKMLPLRNAKDQRVDRQDVAVYTNEELGQVMLAYAPTEDDRVEFILFQRHA